MSTKATPCTELLPDVEGWVHGIKSDTPWTIQCDDCLTCFTDERLIFAAKAATFNAHAPGLRLCPPCWEQRGWRYGYDGWRPL